MFYVVFDCNVLVQAAANGRNASSACFRLVENKKVRLYVSQSTINELENVLNGDFVKSTFNYTDKVIEEFLTKVRSLGKKFSSIPKVFHLSRDVDGEEYINLAVASKADYIVTRDNDLLDLITGFDDISKQISTTV